MKQGLVDPFFPDFRDERLRRLPAGKDPSQFEDYCGPFIVETIEAKDDLVIYRTIEDEPDWDILIAVRPKSRRVTVGDKVGERWMLSFDYPNRR